MSDNEEFKKAMAEFKLAMAKLEALLKQMNNNSVK